MLDSACCDFAPVVLTCCEPRELFQKVIELGSDRGPNDEEITRFRGADHGIGREDLDRLDIEGLLHPRVKKTDGNCLSAHQIRVSAFVCDQPMLFDFTVECAMVGDIPEPVGLGPPRELVPTSYMNILSLVADRSKGQFICSNNMV